jgi:hypothetical protein
LAEEKKCGQLQAPKKPDRKWMNIKNISFKKQCTHFSLQTELEMSDPVIFQERRSW